VLAEEGISSSRGVEASSVIVGGSRRRGVDSVDGGWRRDVVGGDGAAVGGGVDSVGGGRR
jgi:hypothetical protein